MTDRATYDAIVVGSPRRGRGDGDAARAARPACARRRSQPLRQRHPVDARAHARGTLQLHRWDVLGDVIASGTPPVRRTVFHYDDGDVDVSIKPAGGVDALYAPRRTVLDAILADAAERAGADVRFGTTVTDLVRADDGRVVGVSGHDRRRRPLRRSRAGDDRCRRHPLGRGPPRRRAPAAFGGRREHARLRLLGRRRRRRLPLVLPASARASV